MGYASKNQGYFKPRNPEKYVGDVEKIRFMSSWELHMHKFLDGNPNVKRWSSEEIAIPYIKPTDNKVHQYYPDYWIEFVDKDGNTHQEIIEVKPDDQTRPPKKGRKKKETVLRENLNWVINEAKWKACAQFCAKYKLKFRIMTEKNMFR